MIGKKLKRIRKERGFTMQEIADRIGVARSTYAGYESDYRQPPLEVLLLIADVLKTSADYIIGLTENPYPKEPTKNAKELLLDSGLHWDGVPLTDEELKPLRDLLEIVVRDRIPKKINENEKEQVKKSENG